MNQPVEGTVEYWAQKKPDNVAVIEGDRSLTWSEWNDFSNQLACALKRRGVTHDDIIVARTQIRVEWIVLQLALAKLGCQLLGLNWRLTPDETKYVLANSGANGIVCDDREPALLHTALTDLPIRVAVSIDRTEKNFEAWSDLLSEPADETLFSSGPPPLIVYTSGTTGRPRGVVMNQARQGTADEMRDYFKSMAERRSQREGDVVLVTMPLHHGAGPALVRESISKGNLQIFQRRYDAEGALALIDGYKVSYWNAVPTMYKRMAVLPQDVLDKYDVSSVRTLSVGAAPVTPDLKNWITSYFGECLSEGYGSTETSMVTSISPEMLKEKPGSSGTPFRHVKIEIRDDNNLVLPVGDTGEIWVRTPVTISSYLNEQNDGSCDDKGFFRTGDVGYLDEDNYLYITDRVKDMIISGGVNIYPAEIEQVLLRHPAIQDVAVIGIPHEEFGEAVMAFCEFKPGHSATIEELEFLSAEHLASYKRPRLFEIVQELPHNSMGKTLKRELREPYWKGRKRQV